MAEGRLKERSPGARHDASSALQQGSFGVGVVVPAPPEAGDIGFWLAFIDFPNNASPETLTQEHLDQLFFMMGPLYYIIVYAGLGFCFMYRITRSRHEEILRELEKRRLQAP